MPGLRKGAELIDLDAIEARTARASSGPWRLDIDACDELTIVDGRNTILMTVDEATEGDRDFLVAARSDIPALVARVRELEATLREALNGGGT